MDPQEKSKSTRKRLILMIFIIAVLIIGFFIFRSGSLGIGNSCNALRNRYESAKEKEDYTEVSKYYQKMNAMDCEF